MFLTDTAGIAADPIADTVERRALRETVRSLVSDIAPPAQRLRLDRAEEFDDELHLQLSKLGALAIGAHLDDGGEGNALDQLVVLEELAAGPTSMAVFMVVHYMGVQVLTAHGSAEQRATWLAPLVTGEARVAFACTEAGGGTDIGRAMRTTARRDGDDWVITGEKCWISGAQRADVFVVLARTTEGTSIDGITMFLVPATTPGIRVSEIPTVAVHGLDTNTVVFDEVRVPPSSVVGVADRGFRLVLEVLNRERLNAAAGAIGAGRAAVEYATAYVAGREAFGSTVGSFQAVQHRLVEAAVAIEAARGLLVRAAIVEVAGGRADVLSSMAKLTASEAAVRATQTGMEVMGGAGFSLEHPMQQWWRDVRLWVFAPLNNDMVRNYLGEQALGLPRSF